MILRLLLLLCLLLTLAPPPVAAVGEARYRVAILPLPDNKEPDRNLEDFAIERVLQTMGIPYDKITMDQLTQKYPLAILPGPYYNYSQPASDRKILDAYLADGGNLIGTHIDGEGYWGFFGLAGLKAARNRFSMHFAPGPEDGWLHLLDTPRERDLSLGDAKKYPQTIWTLGYKLHGGRAVATFPDGSAAIVTNQYGKGRTLALGFDLVETVLRAQVEQTYGAGRQYANTFEPSTDVIFQVIKQFYESVAQPAVYWHPVPDGKDTSIVLSHDIDASESFRNAVQYAKVEQTYGVYSTIFVNTKNFVDLTDKAFYDETRIPFMAQLKQMGYELGSHTVSHSLLFASFPVGDASITIQTYDPVKAPTVYGEVKVSKDLLTRDIPGAQIVSFRAGDLAFPDRLIEVLQANGYHNDSTFSANSLTTTYPFFAFLTKHIGGPETVSKIVEIPVSTDDSQGHLIAPTKDQVFEEWSNIIESNRANNGVTCMLIHPTNITYKLDVERRILDRFAKQNVWIGTIGALGDFWARRAAVGFRVDGGGGALTIHLDKKREELGPHLALALANQASAGTVKVQDSSGKEVPYRQSGSGGKWILVLTP